MPAAAVRVAPEPDMSAVVDLAYLPMARFAELLPLPAGAVAVLPATVTDEVSTVAAAVAAAAEAEQVATPFMPAPVPDAEGPLRVPAAAAADATALLPSRTAAASAAARAAVLEAAPPGGALGTPSEVGSAEGEEREVPRAFPRLTAAGFPSAAADTSAAAEAAGPAVGVVELKEAVCAETPSAAAVAAVPTSAPPPFVAVAEGAEPACYAATSASDVRVLL